MIWQFILGNWQKLLALLGAVAAFVTARQSGRKSAENKQLKDAAKREQRGRDAATKEKRDTRDADKHKLIDRLRGRDGDFGGM